MAGDLMAEGESRKLWVGEDPNSFPPRKPSSSRHLSCCHTARRRKVPACKPDARPASPFPRSYFLLQVGPTRRLRRHVGWMIANEIKYMNRSVSSTSMKPKTITWETPPICVAYCDSWSACLSHLLVISVIVCQVDFPRESSSSSSPPPL